MRTMAVSKKATELDARIKNIIDEEFSEFEI